MEERVYALFGVFGPLLVYVSIALSLVLSPWFSWESNALSDLGHAVNSNVASIFNLGLLLAGFLLMIYALTVFQKHAKYSSFCLLVSTFYTVEKRSAVALITFVIVMFSWLLYGLNIFNIGIAVPETVSKLVVAWIMYSAIKIYFGKESSRL